MGCGWAAAPGALIASGGAEGGLWPPSPPPKRQPVPQIEPVRGGISGLIEPDRETPRENSAAAANRDTATNLTALETARPTGSSAPYFTGLAGKPTSWHLIATECRRLWQAGERHPGGGAARQSAAEWARVLIAWLHRVHPEAPPTTEKTVSNKLP